MKDTFITFDQGQWVMWSRQWIRVADLPHQWRAAINMADPSFDDTKVEIYEKVVPRHDTEAGEPHRDRPAADSQ
jgi:hypothetical protein